MEERRFKIRNNLIITVQADEGETFYTVINPFSGSKARFDAKAYLVLRHFNGRRNIGEVQRHLKQRHGLDLSSKALESYMGLFLDLYLFDADCLGFYWERLDHAREGLLAEELNKLAGKQEKDFPQSLPFVESMVLNGAVQSLKNKDVLRAINYLKDALKINPQNYFAQELLQNIEKELIDIGMKPKIFLMARDFKGKAKELNYAPVIVLLLGIILSQTLFLNHRPNFGKFREADLNIIKVVNDTLLKTKLDTL